MFTSYRKDTRTDNERYLEDELQRERDQRREDEEREQREREARAKEQREEHEYNVRHPDSWPEAFRNQASLCWREHNMFPEQNGDYFKVTAEANEEALEIWREVYAEKAKQIEEIQNSIRAEVADKLEAASTRNEYKFVASAIRGDALDGYCDW